MIKKILISTLLFMAVSFSFGQSAIKLKKDGSIYLIPCKINGMDFDLYFDTGASLVSLSLKEAKKLMIAGKLKVEDIIGKTQMTIANGQLVNGTIILIKELKIGDLDLKDIEAVITESQTAPLLLGQSAISKFGEFTFDYTTQTLKINRSNKQPFQIVIPTIKPEYKASLSPQQISDYEDFLKNKFKIVEGIHVDLLKYKTEKTIGGFNVNRDRRFT